MRRTLERGRRRAEALMTDTVAIDAPSKPSPGDWDEATGEYRPGRAPIYTGRARVRSSLGVGYSRDVQGDQTTVTGVVLSLPVVGSESVGIGHRVTVTESPHDPGNVGQVYRVVAIPSRTDATARRFQVELYQ